MDCTFYHVHSHGPQYKQVFYAVLCHLSDIYFLYNYYWIQIKSNSANSYGQGLAITVDTTNS